MLRNRNFRLLWLAQIISTVAYIFYEVGVMVTIFERTGSALQTAGVTIMMTLPPFVLGPLAGVVVDRYPRKWIMVGMDGLRALLVGLLLIMAQANALELWVIYGVVAGLAIAQTFYDPARLATVPSLVAKRELVQANSLVMSTTQAAFAIGFGLGGVLILSLGFQPLVMLNITGFILAALVVSFISLPRRSASERPPVKPPSLYHDLMAGLTYLRQHGLARPLIVMETTEFLPHAIWTPALMLVFATQALGASPEGWGYQNSAFFSGQLIGATVATFMAVSLARRPGWVIIGNAFLSGLLTLAYAFSPNLMIAIILCTLFGPTSAMRDVAQDSLLQASVKSEVLGRIYATRLMLANLSFMIGGACFAWLADQMPVRWIYFLGGCLYLGSALYALSSRAIRRSRIMTTTGQVNQSLPAASD